jgi:hypothetical protein
MRLPPQASLSLTLLKPKPGFMDLFHGDMKEIFFMS